MNSKKNKNVKNGSKHSKLKRPSVSELNREISRLDSRKRYLAALKGAFFTLVVVAAAALLIASTVLRVMRVYGTSMEDTLSQGDILVGTSSKSVKKGDIVAFYNNNKVLLKRVIALAGDVVDIDEDGNVYVNDERLEEDYIKEKSLGICDRSFPVIVGEGEIFVLGDNRTTALDSRASAIGNISDENIICRVALRIWPLSKWTLF